MADLDALKSYVEEVNANVLNRRQTGQDSWVLPDNNQKGVDVGGSKNFKLTTGELVPVIKMLIGTAQEKDAGGNPPGKDELKAATDKFLNNIASRAKTEKADPNAVFKEEAIKLAATYATLETYLKDTDFFVAAKDRPKAAAAESKDSPELKKAKSYIGGILSSYMREEPYLGSNPALLDTNVKDANNKIAKLTVTTSDFVPVFKEAAKRANGDIDKAREEVNGFIDGVLKAAHESTGKTPKAVFDAEVKKFQAAHVQEEKKAAAPDENKGAGLSDDVMKQVAEVGKGLGQITTGGNSPLNVPGEKTGFGLKA